MRELTADAISDAVAAMCQRANFVLGEDVRRGLERGLGQETSPVARSTLLRILENAAVAEADRVPMCQDTGLVVVFAEVGQDLRIRDGLLREAIDAGVRLGYREGFLRASVAPDPVLRGNTGDNTPAMLHVELVPGDRLRLRLLAKGGGCENMSRFAMLAPAAGRAGIVEFVVETAKLAGPNACPPLVVGVGLGGSFEVSAVLAKKSLLRETGAASPHAHLAALEREIVERINASGIGPQGYGGDTTALAVHVEATACHIASLPVSVNIECHAHRHQEVVL
jgi:fumarate hydratase subunit alpha